LGETLRQKDRNPFILWREPLERPPKGKSRKLSGLGVISQVKGQGSFGIIPKLPCFLLGGFITVFELCRLPIEEIEWRCKTFIEGGGF